MRRAAILAIGVALFAREARADGAFVLSSLPPAPADQRRERPSRVEGSEVVQGLWVSAPRTVAVPAEAKKGKKKAEATKGPFVVVAPSAIVTTFEASAIAKLKLDTRPIAGSGVCLRTSDDGVTWAVFQPSTLVLETAGAPVPSIDSSDTVRVAVHDDLKLVRVERLLESAEGKATLEAVDAWVDVRTGGAREVARSATPLVMVQKAPGGLPVYAARSGDKAIFVVSPPRAPAPVKGTPGRCGFARVELTTDKPGEVASDTVGGEIAVPVGEEPAEGEGRTFRIRSFRLSFSAIWLTGEPSPALGVSFGWVGRTRLEPRDPP